MAGFAKPAGFADHANPSAEAHEKSAMHRFALRYPGWRVARCDPVKTWLAAQLSQ